ncbi:hypothetical protein PUMCH_001044 [Australozyma saopauloensis]|uniref:Uncharacterized protein n=1 Tax=Australozyma saopauloensis TaxID=291208 RepID=A0AAX4H5J8_9ASCO|nr:hypothetical protein PUMCH_001044 [[Candida] saopauloensis]
MSDIKAYKKADLAIIARELGLPVRSKDTKVTLLEKLAKHAEDSPASYKEALLVFSKDDDDSAETVTLVEADATEEEEEPEEIDVEVDVIEDDDEEEAEGDEDDEEETDVADDEEDDAEDKDYQAGPPIDLKEKLVDPAIAATEKLYEMLLEFTDNIGLTSAEYNDLVRYYLSSVVNLSYLELLAEVGYFLYFYVPVVEARRNKFLPQLLKDNVALLNTSLPTLDFSTLLDINVITVLAQWILYAIFVPGLISYYVNFSRKVVYVETDDDEDEEDFRYVVRLYRFDPLIFALSKLILFYYIIRNGAVVSTLDTYEGVFHALKEFFLVKLGIYHDFAIGMGNFPLVIGAANVVIGLYSQFEDF